jgi:phosphoglycolate phosphatase-like HAD superfamily hydrolase
MAIDHIVWDWNGTLFDDGEALILATIDAFAACGLPVVTRETYRAHFTRPITDFYRRLAGTELTAVEQADLAACFQQCYERHVTAMKLHPDAVAALTAWADAGRTQSLLTMYPSDRLRALAALRPIEHFFVRVDGTAGDELPRKEPHLRQHLAALGRKRVLMVGDNVDDVAAATACGIACVLYHPGERALLSDTRARELDVPVVTELGAAVRFALADISGLVAEHADERAVDPR